jgi:hypothetical protein
VKQLSAGRRSFPWPTWRPGKLLVPLPRRGVMHRSTIEARWNLHPWNSINPRHVRLSCRRPGVPQTSRDTQVCPTRKAIGQLERSRLPSRRDENRPLGWAASHPGVKDQGLTRDQLASWSLGVPLDRAIGFSARNRDPEPGRRRTTRARQRAARVASERRPPRFSFIKHFFNRSGSPQRQGHAILLFATAKR